MSVFFFSSRGAAGDRIYWVVGGPGKSLGRVFAIICFAPTSDANYHWNISPGVRLDVWGWIFLFPLVSGM